MKKYAKAIHKYIDSVKITAICVDCGKTFECLCRTNKPCERCYLCRRKQAAEKQKEYRCKERREKLATAEHKLPAEKIFRCNVCFCEFKSPATSHPKYCKNCRKAARKIRAADSRKARRKARRERVKSRKAPQERIADIMKKAAAEGLTYGQYMARKGK